MYRSEDILFKICWARTSLFREFKSVFVESSAGAVLLDFARVPKNSRNVTNGNNRNFVIVLGGFWMCDFFKREIFELIRRVRRVHFIYFIFQGFWHVNLRIEQVFSRSHKLCFG